MPATLALSGPAGAARYGLDGFAGLEWPPSWCAPLSGRRGPRIIRTRRWQEPLVVAGELVAPPHLVLRHLGAHPRDLIGRGDRITPADRVELALEHCLRLGLVTIDQLSSGGGSQPGDLLLQQVIARREDDVPTESYAETRAVQRFRTFGLRCWRQMPIWDRGRIHHRVDLVIPRATTVRMPFKPDVLKPHHGLLVEIDGREFHEHRFEEDHQRQSTYDALGLRWVSFTPNQIERHQAKVRRAIEGAMRRR